MSFAASTLAVKHGARVVFEDMADSVESLRNKLQQQESQVHALKIVRDFYRENPPTREMLDFDGDIQRLEGEISGLRQRLGHLGGDS